MLLVLRSCGAAGSGAGAGVLREHTARKHEAKGQGGHCQFFHFLFSC